MAGPSKFKDKIDEYRKWFASVYPQYTLRVHYIWESGYKEHSYYFEIDGPKKLTLPLPIPELWFEDPIAYNYLQDAFLGRMQQKTMQALE